MITHSPRHICVPSIYAYVRACIWGDSSFEHTLSPSSIYTHILSRHIYVITVSYLKCGSILTYCYVSV